jgi:hypothetical protein
MKRLSQAEAMALADRMTPADRKALGIKTREESERCADAVAERDIQRLCEQWLSLRGIVFHHLSMRAREQVGYPDLTFVYRRPGGLPIPFAIELKTATGKLSIDQARMLHRMRENGWHTAVCRSFAEFVATVEGKQ